MRKIGKGTPKRGFRMTKRRREALAKGYKLDNEGNAIDPKTGVVIQRFDGYKNKTVDLVPTADPEPEMTDAEREVKISRRFRVLKTICQSTVEGKSKAMIVSGPPGLSKSYTVEDILQKYDPKQNVWTIIKGYVRATGLFKLLYQHRMAGQVLVFDDADSIFSGSDAETSLNMLKAVLDTTERRVVSYLSNERIIDETDSSIIPQTFDFEGSCIFITNYDFDALVASGNKLSHHLAALQSRSHYVDLAMKTKRDFLVRIKQVVREDGMLRQQGLSKKEESDVIGFIEDNLDNLRDLSLRTAIKVGVLRKHEKDWQDIAAITCCVR